MKNWIISFALLAVATPQTVLATEDLTVTGDQVVYDLPTGAVEKTYLLEGNLFREWGSDAIKTETLSASLSHIAETSDGKVYIPNALSNVIYGETKGYLVGTRSDNSVTFSFPQVLQKGDEFFAVMRLEETLVEIPGYEGISLSRPTYKICEDSQEVTFTIEEGKFVQNPDVFFGFVKADGEWAGYGEYNLTFTPFDEQPITVPEDAEAFNVAFKYESTITMKDDPGIYRLLSGRRKGNEVYIQGLSYNYPESWFMGTINGDRITFENGQLLGIGNYEIEFFCTGIDSPEFIPGYNEWAHNFSLTPSLELEYNETTGEISALDKNDCFILNSSQSAYANGETYLNPNIMPQGEIIDPTPIMPVFKPGVNKWDNGMEPFLSFQVRPLNIYGQLLDQNNLGFTIEVEGKPYIFSADAYWMNEDMTIIPWGFNDVFISMLSNGSTWIEFQEPFLRDVAIRTVYKVGDKVYYSDPQYPDDPKVQDPMSNIKQISSESTSIVATRYFDLRGNVVSNPERGIFIRQAIHEDGSVSHTKIIL